MSGTFVILDGLQDPTLAQKLSRRWADAGLSNTVDPAGQSAWLGVAAGGEWTSAEARTARTLARSFGLELHETAGTTFRPDSDLSMLRRHVSGEWRRRLTVALIFVTPALLLHYAGPYLAGNGRAQGMVLPWLIELLLTGWACIVAGWPILWQGALSLVNRRISADLLTSALLVGSYLPSAAGVAAMALTSEPWFGPQPGSTPMCHATALTLTLAVSQRCASHRMAGRMAGRAMMMLPRFGRLVAAWLVVVVVLGLWDWRAALALGMLLPPSLSQGAINPWTPGWSAVLPVIGFAGMLLVGPGVLPVASAGLEVEIAAGFGLIMTLIFVLGWLGLKPLRDPVNARNRD